MPSGLRSYGASLPGARIEGEPGSQEAALLLIWHACSQRPLPRITRSVGNVRTNISISTLRSPVEWCSLHRVRSGQRPASLRLGGISRGRRHWGE